MAERGRVANIAETSQQFLTFRLSDERQSMLPTQQLVEILKLPLSQITPIPDISPYVMGVCNWRGEVVWVIDIGYMLGFEPLYQHGYVQQNHHIILLQSLLQGQAVTLGLAVSQIGQTLWCDPAQILPVPTTLADANLSRYLRGYWLTQTGEAVLALDGEALIGAFQ